MMTIRRMMISAVLPMTVLHPHPTTLTRKASLCRNPEFVSTEGRPALSRSRSPNHPPRRASHFSKEILIVSRRHPCRHEPLRLISASDNRSDRRTESPSSIPKINEKNPCQRERCTSAQSHDQPPFDFMGPRVDSY
jgi:hypothetical protein